MKDSGQRSKSTFEVESDSPEHAPLRGILAESGIPDFGLRQAQEAAGIVQPILEELLRLCEDIHPPDNPE